MKAGLADIKLTTISTSSTIARSRIIISIFPVPYIDNPISRNQFTPTSILKRKMSHLPETLSLLGKTAIITGSGRETGIGAAIARALARNGANVAIHYVSESSKARAEKVAGDIEREFGTKTVVVRGGVESLDNAEGMVRDVLEGLGVERVDILG